jgi:hypothetical protein
MSDWQVGDLAVCVSVSHPNYPHPFARLQVGRAYTVEAVGRPIETWNGRSFGGERALGLCEVKPDIKGRGYPESLFRKVRPDITEACEEEFVTLLKKSKRKVDC